MTRIDANGKRKVKRKELRVLRTAAGSAVGRWNTGACGGTNYFSKKGTSTVQPGGIEMRLPLSWVEMR